MLLARLTYGATNNFPRSEQYGLVSQMRRAAVSIPSNIAEGAARASSAEFSRFLYYSLGSLAELETQILIATDLGFLSHRADLEEALVSTRRLILGLVKSLRCSS